MILKTCYLKTSGADPEFGKGHFVEKVEDQKKKRRSRVKEAAISL